MKKLLLAAVAVVVLSACESQQALYSWYNSEDAEPQTTNWLLLWSSIRK